MTIPKNAIPSLIRDALPLLMRPRIMEAVLEAQRTFGEPVTAQQARDTQAEPVMRSARSFSEAARAIVTMGPDERGRVLCRVGRDRTGVIRWWVQESSGSAE